MGRFIAMFSDLEEMHVQYVIEFYGIARSTITVRLHVEAINYSYETARRGDQSSLLNCTVIDQHYQITRRCEQLLPRYC